MSRMSKSQDLSHAIAPHWPCAQAPLTRRYSTARLKRPAAPWHAMGICLVARAREPGQAAIWRPHLVCVPGRRTKPSSSCGLCSLFSLSSLPVFDIHLSTQSRRRVRVFLLLSCYCHSLPCVLVTTFIRYLARRKVLSDTRLLRKHLTAYA